LAHLRRRAHASARWSLANELDSREARATANFSRLARLGVPERSRGGESASHRAALGDFGYSSGAARCQFVSIWYAWATRSSRDSLKGRPIN
jgi:hypothetical protein